MYYIYFNRYPHENPYLYYHHYTRIGTAAILIPLLPVLEPLAPLHDSSATIRTSAATQAMDSRPQRSARRPAPARKGAENRLFDTDPRAHQSLRLPTKTHALNTTPSLLSLTVTYAFLSLSATLPLIRKHIPRQAFSIAELLSELPAWSRIAKLLPEKPRAPR